MDSLTYAIIIGAVFFTGVFIFTYFETPRKTLDRGIRSLDKGIKKFTNVQITNLKRRTNRPLSVPHTRKITGKQNDRGDINVYVHEY